jgi:dissimilatory sulfite reductase (desulfoviridin) alpha/beta subunit
MYYTVYKTTNQVNGKFYIGTHKTVDLNDDYIGSGKYLKYAIEKHGIENFKKEILFVFDNPEEMFAKETEIVTEDFLAEENTYNIE